MDAFRDDTPTFRHRWLPSFRLRAPFWREPSVGPARGRQVAFKARLKRDEFLARAEREISFARAAQNRHRMSVKIRAANNRQEVGATHESPLEIHEGTSADPRFVTAFVRKRLAAGSETTGNKALRVAEYKQILTLPALGNDGKRFGAGH
jgi:hypothetical protein